MPPPDGLEKGESLETAPPKAPNPEDGLAAGVVDVWFEDESGGSANAGNGVELPAPAPNAEVPNAPLPC